MSAGLCQPAPPFLVSVGKSQLSFPSLPLSCPEPGDGSGSLPIFHMLPRDCWPGGGRDHFKIKTRPALTGVCPALTAGNVTSPLELPRGGAGGRQPLSQPLPQATGPPTPRSQKFSPALPSLPGSASTSQRGSKPGSTSPGPGSQGKRHYWALRMPRSAPPLAPPHSLLASSPRGEDSDATCQPTALRSTPSY